ncbi:MAG: MBOAT family O-acyltransferase [Syntrophobacteraceae bacterium]
MLFSSVVFIFFFLPVVLTLYLLPSNRWRNLLFLCASFFFYAWSEGAYLLVLLLSIFGNYLFGLWLARAGTAPAGGEGAKSGKVALISGLCFNLGLLAVFKYTNFFTANLNALLGWGGLAPVALNPVYAPLGISFFTFHAISYLVDVYRGDAPARKSPAGLALYMAAFPKILAGPIAFYRNSAAELDGRALSCGRFLYGLERFITGLAKKVLIATPLAGIADAAFGVPAASLDPLAAWAGIVCYSLQIYFDFSGYSDMAIGLGRMFGFDYPENFNYPYISQSVREFWQRWHISLSTWFRDYLYIPLGGNRCAPPRQYLNLIVVFLLCGLWHGASWNFIVWGAWYGFFLALERTRLGDIIRSAWRPVRHLYLLLVMVIGWVFFRAEGLGYATAYLGAMVGLRNGSGSEAHFAVAVNNEVLAIVPLAVALCFPISGQIRRIALLVKTRAQHSLEGASFAFSAAYAVFLSMIFAISCMSLAGSTQKAFIYFKF